MSSTSRRWTETEDELLAETVKDYMEKGKFKGEAFRDVGEAVGRTGGACATRYNELTATGKVERAQRARPGSPRIKVVEPSEYSIVEDDLSPVFQLESLLSTIRSEFTSLQTEVKDLRSIKKKYEQLNQEHQLLMSIIERARTEVLGLAGAKVQSFKMEQNGNLTAVDND